MKNGKKRKGNFKTYSNNEVNNKVPRKTLPHKQSDDGRDMSDIDSMNSNRFILLAEEQHMDKINTNEEADIIKQIKGDNDERRSSGIKNVRKEITAVDVITSQEMKEKLQSSIGSEKHNNKPPPIVSFYQKIRDTINIMRKIRKNNNYKIKNINSIKHILTVEDMKTYKTVKMLLQKTNTQFFMYAPKTEKLNTLLLKGIDPNSDPTEILQELQRLVEEDITILSVKQFQTKRSRETPRKLPMFLVQISANSKTNNLIQIKQVNHQIVRWEKLKKKDMIQCKRCQRLEHTAANCTLQYRCVKCEGDHDPGKCKIDKSDNNSKTQLFCVLCKNQGHPASYRGCPRYIELKNRIKNKKENNKNSMECYINNTILKLQKHKSKLLTKIKNIYRQLNNQRNNQLIELKAQLKNTKQLIKENFKISVNKYWNNKIKLITTKNKNMFDNINKIFRNNNINNNKIATIKLKQNQISLINEAQININNTNSDSNNNIILEEDKDKIAVIGTIFEKTFKKNIPDIINRRTQDTEIEVYEKVDKFTDKWENDIQNNRQKLCDFTRNQAFTSNYKDFFTTFKEVEGIFRNLNNKKSTGNDNIANFILKKIPNILIEQYVTIFNNMLNIQYFPQNWKTATVIPLTKKKKDPSDPYNYRPINLLPNISKVFECIMNNRLQDDCDKNNIIPETQFGFRKNHSTVNAINKLISDISWGLKNNSFTKACLIDFEKAFDSIWTEGLIYKLLQYNFNEYTIRMIYNMISNKTFKIRHGNITLERNFTVNKGLQQGTINAPILYNIYTSDITNNQNYINENRDINIISFADDTIIYRTDKTLQNINTKLQKDFDYITDYCSLWKIKINTEKCETIMFRKPLYKTSHKSKTQLKELKIINKYNNSEIKQKDQVKYLGVTLDKLLYNTTHVNIQLEKARKAFNKINRLFFSKQLNKKIKIVAYQALIRPILSYSCATWYNLSPSYMEKLRIFERHCLRTCINTHRAIESHFTKYISNKNLYNKTNIIRIDNYIIKTIRNYYLRAFLNHNNSLIKGPTIIQDQYLEDSLTTNYSPPEAFLLLDKTGRIQDPNGIPIIYHWYRRSQDKTIQIPINTEANTRSIQWRYDMSISYRDQQDTIKDKHKYWWIHEYCYLFQR